MPASIFLRSGNEVPIAAIHPKKTKRSPVGIAGPVVETRLDCFASRLTLRDPRLDCLCSFVREHNPAGAALTAKVYFSIARPLNGREYVPRAVLSSAACKRRRAKVATRQ